jgi:proteic killer suppression protein
LIKSFKCKDTEALNAGRWSKKFQGFDSIARRKLRILDAASSLQEIGIVPGNRLESLKGNRAGQYSIRINDQWRVCFVWKAANAEDVEIVDYH